MNLQGSTLCVVGLGSAAKHHLYHDIRAWQIELVLCTDSRDEVPNGVCDDLILIEGLAKHSDDQRLAMIIEAELNKRGISPDGFVTFWEDCGPLTALLAERSNKVSNGYKASLTAKSKLLTQECLRQSSVKIGMSLDCPSIACNSVEELNEGLKVIQFPAMLKLEHGSGAAGVQRVDSFEDAQLTLSQLLAMEDEDGKLGIGLGFGSRVLLTEYVLGTEHDVDIVSWAGEVVSSFVTENGKTRPPSQAETYAEMPASRFESELVEAAVTTCQSLGLHSGVFNIEMIRSPDGKISVIDVNARMAGFYFRDWIKRIWDYDLLRAAVEIALGVKPAHAKEASRTLAGYMILPSAHNRWLLDNEKVAKLNVALNKEYVVLNQFSTSLSSIEKTDFPWGNLACEGPTIEVARSRINKIVHEVGLLDVDPTLLQVGILS